MYDGHERMIVHSKMLGPAVDFIMIQKQVLSVKNISGSRVKLLAPISLRLAEAALGLLLLL